MPGVGKDGGAVAEVFSGGIGDHDVSEGDINPGIFGKPCGYTLQGAFQVLLVAIQVGANLASCAGEAFVDGIIHPCVGFGEDF